MFFFTLGQVRGGNFQEEKAHCRGWNAVTPWVSCQPWTFSWTVNSVLGGWIAFHFTFICEWTSWFSRSLHGKTLGGGCGKRGEKTVACPDSHRNLATSFRELYLWIFLFRVVCNYFSTDITKRTITMWLFLSVQTQLIPYNRFWR